MERVRYSNIDRVLEGTKVFFTETDEVGQKIYKVSLKGLTRDFKVQLLLSDYLLVQASHFFESPLTFAVFRDHPQLLENGIVVPNLRATARDFQDFVELKLSEGDPYFRASILNLRQVAKFLDAHTAYATYWVSGTSREKFRNTLIYELEDPNSDLRRRLRGEPRGNVEKFLSLVKATSALEISRSFLLKQADRIFSRRARVVKNYLNLLYYLYGAPGVDSVVHSSVFEAFKGRYLIPRSATAKVGEEELFSKYLEMLALDPSILDKLSIEQILTIRESDEGKQFRAAWQDLTEKDFSGLAEGDLNLILGAWQERLRRELKHEIHLSNLLQHGKTALEVVSLAVGLLGNQPLVGVASAMVETMLLDPLMEILLVKSKRFRLLVFANRLRRSVRNKIYS